MIIMAATKWRCTKCGRITSTNGGRPFAGICPKSLLTGHSWVKDTFGGPFFNKLFGGK